MPTPKLLCERHDLAFRLTDAISMRRVYWSYFAVPRSAPQFLFGTQPIFDVCPSD